MKVRPLRNLLPAAATILVLALVAGACGSDEEAADARHGVFEDTEAEFTSCLSTEEDNKTVTVCPDGSQRVVYESGGGYTLTALDENECQTKYWDDEHYLVSREDCGDGSYEEEHRHGHTFGRTATDAQGCRGYYDNSNYESFDCEDGSGWGKNETDGAWTRTPTDAEGCTYLVSQIHSETACDDGSGSGVDRSGFTWSRDAYDADRCRTTLYGGGSLVSSRNCQGGAEYTVFRGGWELSADAYPYHSGLDCRTTTWSSGGVVAATDQWCGILASESNWFDGLSWATAAQEDTTDAEGVRERCTTRSFNNGIDERDCDFTEGYMYVGDVVELVNREDTSLILRVENRSEEEGSMWCQISNASGIISGNARSCFDRNLRDLTQTVTLGDLTYATQPGDSDDCTVYSSNFDEDVQVCFDAETRTRSGVLTDGTSWTSELDGRCRQFTTDEAWSESVCWTDRGGRIGSGVMRDGTIYESVDLIGDRTGWVVNDETVQVDDWAIRSPERALAWFGDAGPGGFAAVPSEFNCSRLSVVVSPRMSLLCAAFDIEPMFTTEFVPPPIDQAAIDQAAALQAAVDEAAAAEEAAAAAEDAAAQAAAAQALAVAEAEQALAQAAADQDAAAQAAAAQDLAQAAAEQAAAETAAAEAAAAEAAAEQAAAEAAAAEAAAAQAAAEQALADAAAEAAAGLVSTGYTAEELASVTSAADFLGISVAEFQSTGVYVIDFLTQLAGGYESVTPLTDPPDVDGSESVTSTWDDQARGLLGRVSSGYGTTDAETQKFGAILLTFFVGIARG